MTAPTNDETGAAGTQPVGPAADAMPVTDTAPVAGAAPEVDTAPGVDAAPSAGDEAAHGTAPMPVPAVRADARFMLAHPAHLLALGFGSGLAPRAPGTFGTLFGWLLFDALLAPWAAWGQLWVVAVGLLAAFAVGVAACERTGRDLGVADHGAMVWDEIVAIVLVLSLIPHGFWWQAAAFALFRLFDVTKPPPIRGFERRHKNGYGVMADDVMAAFFALIVLALAKHLIG